MQRSILRKSFVWSSVWAVFQVLKNCSCAILANILSQWFDTDLLFVVLVTLYAARNASSISLEVPWNPFFTTSLLSNWSAGHCAGPAMWLLRGPLLSAKILTPLWCKFTVSSITEASSFDVCLSVHSLKTWMRKLIHRNEEHACFTRLPKRQQDVPRMALANAHIWWLIVLKSCDS